MKHTCSIRLASSGAIMSMLPFCFLLVGMISCTKLINLTQPIAYVNSPMSIDSAKPVDWNLLFQPGTSSGARTTQINNVKDYISAFWATYGFVPYFHETYCPCDSMLYNLNAYPVNASGQSVNPPPPPPPPHGGSGDNIAFIAKNNGLDIDLPRESEYSSAKGKLTLNNSAVISPSRVLAIMDTGLDTAYFDNIMKKMIWSAENGRTLRNFTFDNPWLPLDYYFDDNLAKHGTGVAGIAMGSIGTTNVYPRIMVLKVLNKDEKGSTFNVSCATSYAIQNHATLINASLGYYNFVHNFADSILLHYLNLCNPREGDSIFVFAAAGNLPLPHSTGMLCSTPVPGNNELISNEAKTRLFYPGSFNDQLPNVISVTGLQSPRQSCFYQNYSTKYVSLGVLNPAQICCQYPLPEMHLGFEGSSFSTPVASGRVMGCLLNTLSTTVPSTRGCLNSILLTEPTTPVTKDGKYIELR